MEIESSFTFPAQGLMWSGMSETRALQSPAGGSAASSSDDITAQAPPPPLSLRPPPCCPSQRREAGPFHPHHEIANILKPKIAIVPPNCGHIFT